MRKKPYKFEFKNPWLLDGRIFSNEIMDFEMDFGIRTFNLVL